MLGSIRMWRHIPKITVLAAIGLMVLIFYVTQWNRSPAPGPGKAAPNVVYINQGVQAVPPGPNPVPVCQPPGPCAGAR